MRNYTKEELEAHCRKLWDTQWMNVVNHDNCYRGWAVDEAVNHAVKMAEKYMRENFEAYAATLRQQAERCPYCDNTGDVHSIDGEWRGECHECKARHAERGDGAVSDEVVGAAWNAYEQALSARERFTQAYKRIAMRAALEAALSAQPAAASLVSSQMQDARACTPTMESAQPATSPSEISSKLVDGDQPARAQLPWPRGWFDGAQPAERQGEAIGEIDWGEDGAFVEIYPDRDLKLGEKIYTHPAAPVGVPDEQALERAVRAHDREDAAQKGEPDPWADSFPEPYRSERLTAMRCAFKAAAPSAPQGVE
jgi:hypothetical protein